jgi:hypothetical protein
MHKRLEELPKHYRDDSDSLNRQWIKLNRQWIKSDIKRLKGLGWY